MRTTHLPADAASELILGTSLDGPPWAKPAPVALSGSDLAAHKHLIGVTGSGKSKLLQSLFLQLFCQGIACCLIDPHGDLCDDLLAALADLGYFASSQAFERLWYVSFADPKERYIPYNVLSQPAFESHAVSRHLLEAWKRAWHSLSGGSAPNLENLVLAGSLVLVENGLPLTALGRLLSDQAFRGRLLTQVDDDEVVAFFRDRFDTWGRRGALLSESTLRRAFLMTFSPALRFSLSQRENRLRARSVMDQGVSVLVNLGGLDEDTQRFLGSLLVVDFEVAALSRADLRPEQRRPYHLLIDEWSQFSATTDVALERVLSLTRKYNLSLSLAHQTWSQLSKPVAGALQNTILIALRLGYDDAAWAAPRLGLYNPNQVKEAADNATQSARPRPVFMSPTEQRVQWQQTLQTLAPQEAFMRLGNTTYHLRTLGIPTPHCSQDTVDAIKERYAQLLLTPKGTILRSMESVAQDDDAGAIGPQVEEERPLRRETARSPRRVRRLVPLDGSDSPWAG